MEQDKQHWFGMEGQIAYHLRARGVSFVSEQDGYNAPSLPNSSIEPGFTYHDFILTGAVPTFIEVKYVQFGNVRPVWDLAVAAARSFSRFKFIVVIVGPYSPEWDAVRPWVSDTLPFDFGAFPEDEIEARADEAVADLLLKVESAKELTLEHFTKLSSGDLGIPLEHDHSPAFRVPPVARLFGSNIPQAIEVITASFDAIVGGGIGEMNTVKRELRELTTEFTSTHYTSCALRLGRCLELAVYAFAMRIGIASQAGHFGCFVNVQDRLGELNAAMQELSEARESGSSEDCEGRRDRLVEVVMAAQNSLSKLLAQIDRLDNNERVVRGPDNIQAILRRAQKQLVNRGSSSEAKQRLAHIVRDNHAKDILRFRNSAAHGDPDLQTREVSEENVVEGLHLLMGYIQELGNVIDTL